MVLLPTRFWWDMERGDKQTVLSVPIVLKVPRVIRARCLIPTTKKDYDVLQHQYNASQVRSLRTLELLDITIELKDFYSNRFAFVIKTILNI